MFFTRSGPPGRDCLNPLKLREKSRVGARFTLLNSCLQNRFNSELSLLRLYFSYGGNRGAKTLIFSDRTGEVGNAIVMPRLASTSLADH